MGGPPRDPPRASDPRHRVTRSGEQLPRFAPARGPGREARDLAAVHDREHGGDRVLGDAALFERGAELVARERVRVEVEAIAEVADERAGELGVEALLVLLLQQLLRLLEPALDERARARL